MAVSHIGGGNNDYASVSLWEAGVQGDLTLSETQEAECYAFADTTAVTIDGSTTDATHYLRVYAASGAEAQMPWSTSAYRLTPGSNTTPMSAFDAFTRIERIQMELATGASNRFGISCGTTPGVRVIGCYIRATGAGAGTQIGINSTVSGAGNYVHVRNTVVTGFNGAGIQSQSGSGEMWAYNTVVANCGSGFNGGGAFTAKNCIAYNNTTDFAGTYAASTNNASEDGTAPDTNEVTITTDPFVDFAGGDFHIESGSEVHDAGADLSADANFPFSDDFDGATRTGTWDLGVDEITGASAAVTGTAGDGTTEADIVAGGQTIIITLTGDTWVTP